ncbi:MAG: anti-sigma factor antagonist [Planctomycetota bacterium]|nr:MAG: anti-sigma factor antagonist [Planctomycetota bacterium]
MEETYRVQPLNQAHGTYELALTGRVYADLAPGLQEELLELVDRGLRNLVVDARELEQIDSSGLNVFVHLLKRLRPLGGKIVFFGLNENIRRVFRITKLETVMGVVEERNEALEGLA